MNIRDGAVQEDRYPAAMAKGYVGVDESSFESLVCQAMEFSSHIVYTGLSDRPQGSWQPMFTSDEAVIFSAMAGFDQDRNMRQYIHLADHGSIGGLIRLNHRLAAIVNRWYRDLSRINHPLARAGSRRILHLIEKKLVPVLADLKFLSHHFHTALDFSRFGPEWERSGAEKDGDATQDNAFSLLGSGFYRLHSGLMLLSDHGRLLLEKSLTSQDHAPATGLFLAFAQLYDRVRAEQNRFTLRHLDFYYDRVLRYRARAPEPDQVYLSFVKAPKADPVFIGKGTGFPAPMEKEGHPKIYRADHDLLVSDTRVTALRTVLYETDPLSAPESDLEMITGISRTILPVRDGTANTPDALGYPFFGALARDPKTHAWERADAGLALCSPVLLLTEGKRQVSLTLTLAVMGKDRPEEGLFLHFLTRAAKLGKTSPDDIFFKVFQHAFSIHLTGEAGWFRVREFAPAVSLVADGMDPDQISISFLLEASDPPVVPWSEPLHGRGYKTDSPVMELRINPESYAYPFSILEDYTVVQADIRVAVSGMKNLLLYNHLGRLDPNGPFQPFGPLAEKESYLVAGCHETAVKALTRFYLRLTWAGLPTERTGFAAHYRGYGMKMDNDQFSVALSMLKDGRWAPGRETQPRMPLFRSNRRDRLSSSVCLDSEGLDLSGSGNPELPAEGFEFNVHSRSGFFKYRLDRPEKGFGHQVYPFLLTRILTENARLSRFKKEHPLPNPPYTPTINSVRAGYTAAARIRPGRLASADTGKGEQLFHIHPFGISRIFPLPGQPPCPLLPQEHRQGRGNLMIGLENLVPGARLSLFFVLKDDAGAVSTEAVPQVSWFYMKSDTWHPFPGEAVALDTTRGFLTSGVVSLDLPRDITCDNAVMGEGTYWIRVSAEEHLRGPASLFTVQAHALLATLEDAGAFVSPLAPGTIKEAVTGLPGITTVSQSQPSFGGRPVGDLAQRNIRMSERLKHKSRASSAWDYERLVLEHFPEVAKAKCFPGISSAAWNCWERRNALCTPKNFACEGCGRYQTPEAPGHLLISIIPKAGASPDLSGPDPEPRADAALLSRIRSFLMARSSAFAAIEVRNPVYEKIQVRCMVRFGDDEDIWSSRQRLNRDITRFISPWHPDGYEAGFGWRIRRTDLVSYIQDLPYVGFITRFSMLRISRNARENYDLLDTVTKDAVRPSEDEKEILPRVPWSLAVNADHHFIQSTLADRPVRPERTGLEELEVGSTFIITG